jgi:DNA-binding NarL/FixJ family response regulator
MAIPVLLVDDHPIVREGLRAVVHGRGGIEVVGEAADAGTALQLAGTLKPAVVVLDLTLAGVSGIEVLPKLVAIGCRVLVLSMHDGEDVVRAAMHAGAVGYVVKGSGLQDLVAAIAAVAAGERFVSPTAARALSPGKTKPGGGLDVLSPREREVLLRVVRGQTSAAIADDLGLSPKTVEGYRASLMQKLELHDLPALVRFAVRTGLVEA